MTNHVSITPYGECYVTTDELEQGVEIVTAPQPQRRIDGILKWMNRATATMLIADIALSSLLVFQNYKHEEAKRDKEIEGIEAALSADGLSADIYEGEPLIWLTPDRGDRTANVDISISADCTLSFVEVNYTGDRTNITDIEVYTFDPARVDRYSQDDVILFHNLADLTTQTDIFPGICYEAQ